MKEDDGQNGNSAQSIDFRPVFHSNIPKGDLKSISRKIGNNLVKILHWSL